MVDESRMNRKKQQQKKGKNKGKSKNKGGGGKKKQQANNKKNKQQNNAKNKQNNNNNNQKKNKPKLKGLFNLNNSLSASAEEKTNLLITGFIRNLNINNNDNNENIRKLCINYSKNVLSILSTEQCQLLVEELIKKDVIKYKKHKFKCLLNGKYDGFEGKTFHKLCNNKKQTLVVIKSEYDYIFGGFTNIPWIVPNVKKLQCEYGQDYNSFLFSFYLSTNKLEIYDIKFDFASFSIENTINKGPIFGYSDIIIGGNNCDKKPISFCKPFSYKINGKGNKLCGGNDDSLNEGYYRFKVDNYEVFQLKQ